LGDEGGDQTEDDCDQGHEVELLDTHCDTPVERLGTYVGLIRLKPTLSCGVVAPL
jgi:hypothetical protein